jgi:hypothetical protein
MPVTAMGPTMAGGTQPIVHGGYELLYLPDVNNYELQRSGQPPVFYWVPNQVRIARKHGPDEGDYLFNLIRFAGVQSAESTVGADEDREVAGGVLTFTVTGAAPDRFLEESQQKIIGQWEASNDFFWGIRSRSQPVFRPAVITSNVTSISNVSPSSRGRVPTTEEYMGSRGRSRRFALRGSPSMQGTLPKRTTGRQVRDTSNLDPWYWRMQGEGTGSIDPSGQNAFSALIGAYPTAILWEAFHGTASPIVVIQSLELKVWSPVVELTIKGEWERVFRHFSVAASGRFLWARADAQAEFNNMRITGGIEVDLKIDPTIPNGEKIQENIEKRSDLVFEKFMDEAKKVIFEPPPPQVEAAEASSGSGPWGVGLALKYRRDQTNLRLEYHEKRQLAYLQNHTISSSLSGMFEEIQADPEAEGKYFLSVHLEDWPRKIARVVKPVVNWQDGAVDFVSAQVGYPNGQGELMWAGHVFQESGANDDTWKYGISQKQVSEVKVPPEGWTPDKTFVKRKVHLSEPPSEIENPYKRIQIDRNQIDIDPEPNGTPLNDTTLEVRADSAGRLAIGPIELGVVLQDHTQTVEATMEPTDDQGRSLGREPVRFVWNEDDQNEDRLWLLFTGDPEFRPFYRYKVRVLVKGTIFEPGTEWEGPWIESAGNGPVTLRIPRKGDPEVTVRSREMQLVRYGPPPNGGPGSPRPRRLETAHRGIGVRGWTIGAGTTREAY